MGNGPFYRYCAVCGIRLGSSDFVSGRALRSGHVIRCIGCARKDFEPPLPPAPEKGRPTDTRRSLTAT
ncbi:MAG: hypothetical protein EHM91_00180 [Planctomycetota bacterium]|nr:MAG: hypothetical protein EHM91_00180 [Planctomycetota bacterium]